jgi:hypothetical protein
VTHNNPADWAVFDDVHLQTPTMTSGSDLIWVPPVNRDFEIAFMSFALNCWSDVVDRFVYVSVVVNIGETIIAWFDTPAKAGELWNFTLGQGMIKQVNVTQKQQTHPLPQRLRIPPNHYIYARALNLQANDTFLGRSAVLNMQVKTNL